MLTVLSNLFRWFVIDLFGRDHADAVCREVRSWFAPAVRRLERWTRVPTPLPCVAVDASQPRARVTEVWIDGAWRSIQAIPDLGPVIVAAAERLFVRAGRKYEAVDTVEEGTQAYRRVGRRYEPLPLGLPVAA